MDNTFGNPRGDLLGKRIIVTGASRGLGRPMALALVRAGARVLFCGTDAASLNAAILESGASPDRAAAHVADLSVPGALERLVKVAHATFGGIDVLVNNAGLGTGSLREDFAINPLRFWEVSDADLRRMLEVNVFLAVTLARLVAPEMIERRWGRIINATTSLSSMLLPGIGPYGWSKAALEAATSAMAGDLAGSGVTANVLIPGGPADTDMIPRNSGMPRERLLRADCQVGPVMWLSSNASDAITGRRFVGMLWDSNKPDTESATWSSDVVAWTGYGRQARMPGAFLER
jgi:NAD(P)-dependent dehydrogenase (short-subunit alcohol dehydrogenase family)